MRAVGYVRVSTQEQAENGWNLDVDRQRIRQIANAEGWELVETFDDGGRQGDDPDRPGFNRMLDTLDQVDVIVMRSLDRLSRDTFLYALATRAIRAAGVKVHTFTGLVDLDSPEGELSSNVLAAIHRFEKRQISVRVRQAKQARAQAGLFPGGKRPYGYRQRDTTHEGKPTGPLVVDPVEAAVVRRMFELAETTSQRKIARILNDEGIPSSQGGRWTQSTVARVLGSPLYLGQIRRRVDGQLELHDGKHKRIVDQDLWDRVNRSRGTPERRAGGRPLTSGHLLSRGLLRCGSCGSAMIPNARRGKPEIYLCIGRHEHGPGFCDQPSVRRVVIDEALLGQLTSRYLDLDGARDRLREWHATELPMAEAALAEAEREVAKAEARVVRVDRGWQDGVLSDAKYRRQSAQLEDELAAALRAVEQGRSRVEQISEAGTATDADEALLAQLADLKALVSGTVEQARDVESLRTVIRQLFVRIDLVAPGEPLRQLFREGVIEPDTKQGSYLLVPTLRSEMVDWTTLQPVKPPLPGNVTLPMCR